MDISDLADLASPTDHRSLGRLITAIADGHPMDLDLHRDVLGALYRRGGRALTLGVTGSPGAGKSTLVSGLVDAALRDQDAPVAVVAIDPSSPFTGGALLGDRIRLDAHVRDARVFVRSLANRGHLGGLSATTPAVITALDAVGFEEIVVETVGVGQAEVDVASACLTTVVVVPAGWGDTVQAAKAGFLEIADVYVVNKADRPEADRTVSDLQSMLDLSPPDGWIPPIVPTVATDRSGVDDVWRAVATHRAYLDETGEIHARLRRIARHTLVGVVEASVRASVDTDEVLVDALVARTEDPWSAAVSIVTRG